MVIDFHDASLRTLSLSCRPGIINFKQHGVEGEHLMDRGGKCGECGECAVCGYVDSEC